MTRIRTLPVFNHNHSISSQGYNLAQFVPDDKPEVLLASDGIFSLEIPDDPRERSVDGDLNRVRRQKRRVSQCERYR